MTAWLRMEGFWKSSCLTPVQAAPPGPSCPRPCPEPSLSGLVPGHPHNEIIPSTERRNFTHILKWPLQYSANKKMSLKAFKWSLAAREGAQTQEMGSQYCPEILPGYSPQVWTWHCTEVCRSAPEPGEKHCIVGLMMPVTSCVHLWLNWSLDKKWYLFTVGNKTD